MGAIYQAISSEKEHVLTFKRIESSLLGVRPQIVRRSVLFPAPFRALSISNLLNIAIHQMSAKILISKSFYGRHLLMMFLKQIIRAIIHAKVPIDALTLDICIVPVKINYRVLEIFYRYTVATKCSGAFRILLLQLVEIRLV